jgi:hypothetical protein
LLACVPRYLLTTHQPLGIVSHASGRPSVASIGGNDGGESEADSTVLGTGANLIGIDERSMVSVRRSTMDLISMYKEQENMEMERVLNMVRTESVNESTTLKGL